MSGKISVDAYTLSGIGQIYEIDIGTSIREFVRTVIETHRAYSDKKKFNIGLVDWNNTRLIYNAKTLDHFKTFEEYTEFQYKSKGPYKMHIVPRGGSIGENLDQLDKIDDSFEELESKKTTRPSSPISIKTSSFGRMGSDRYTVSRSFPGTNSFPGSSSSPGNGSFLENQINRIDRRQRSDSLKQVSDSLCDISNYLKDLSVVPETDSSDKLDKILQVLVSIDTKLNRLIDMGTPTS